MIRTTFVVAAASLAAAAAATAAPQTSHPTLHGTVGPGFTITLKQHGKTVKTLQSGTYRLVIADDASIHAFSLDGPHGYAKDFTGVPFMGSKTFTVKLVDGKYKYYCPPHESIMFGRFTVKG